MNEPAHILQVIHDELARLDQEIVGELDLSEDSLTAMGGKLTLNAVVHHDEGLHSAIAHCHVTARVADEQTGHLDACLIGINPDRAAALADAAQYWINVVAGPIFSLLHERPVLGTTAFDGSESYGVSGCSGYVGPKCARMLAEADDMKLLDDTPSFDFAAEMAPPGIVHLTKVTLEASGEAGWNRTLEVDGHSATHVDRPWPAVEQAPAQGIVSQFAVFHYADQTQKVDERKQVDDTIRRYVAMVGTSGDTNNPIDTMLNEGVPAELLDQIATYAPLAFGRAALNSIGATFSPTYVQLKQDGTTTDGLQLMHQPVFARSIILSQEFMSSAETIEGFKLIALSSSEVVTINNAMNEGSKPEDLALLPPIIPDHGVSDETIQRTMKELIEKIESQRNIC